LIDPLDGTKNFVVGDPNFGVIVALVKAGRTVAGWMVFPASGQILETEEGAGTLFNGKRIWTSESVETGRLRGTVYSRFMPSTIAPVIRQQTADRFEPQFPSGSAAIEYSTVLQGRKEFVLYYRLLPWDHAAGALALTEAGGRVEHSNGYLYSPKSLDQVTIVSANSKVAEKVSNWLR
jgi:fructose-1,6-bisphosphatase/inositol monophosphatase family enzyme